MRADVRRWINLGIGGDDRRGMNVSREVRFWKLQRQRFVEGDARVLNSYDNFAGGLEFPGDNNGRGTVGSSGKKGLVLRKGYVASLRRFSRSKPY